MPKGAHTVTRFRTAEDAGYSHISLSMSEVMGRVCDSFMQIDMHSLVGRGSFDMCRIAQFCPDCHWCAILAEIDGMLQVPKAGVLAKRGKLWRTC